MCTRNFTLETLNQENQKIKELNRFPRFYYIYNCNWYIHLLANIFLSWYLLQFFIILTCSTSLCIYRCMNNIGSMGGIRYHDLDNVNITFNFTTAIHNFLNWSVILWLCQLTIFTLTFRRSNPSTIRQPAL